ncbi:hypothetical protein [Streptomyces sviceus]|uniref:hypothetical protein n=1 Tax=Streptomyces sviceus TaxID=285530 RepID=UPI00332C240B
MGASAAGVLRFSEERDPAALTQFVRLRVIDPEKAYWRRGIEAATRWLRETGESELRVPFTYVTPEDWGAGIGGHPPLRAPANRTTRGCVLPALLPPPAAGVGLLCPASVHASGAPSAVSWRPSPLRTV